MNRITKVVVVVFVVLLALFGLYRFMIYRTKQISPETLVSYKKGDANIEIIYSRPSKKGRQIFDSLVPFGKVWRTGANEPTILTTNKDLIFAGTPVAAGKYTLWTIPGENEWTFILNKKLYGWGINFNGEASREAAEDALSVQIPIQKTQSTTETFTISFEEQSDLQLVLDWEQTKIKVPFSIGE